VTRRGPRRKQWPGVVGALASLAFSIVTAPPRAQAAPSPPPAPPQPGQAPAAPVVTPPKLLSESAVAYPEEAKGDATVVLTLTINADGTVRSATATETNEPFSSQAVGAALGWSFEPARRDGRAISAIIRFEVVFHEPPPPEIEPEPELEPATAEQSPDQPRAPRPPPVTEVTVRGERAEPSRSVTLSRAEVRQIPGTFGDPFRAIEVMPGVTPIVTGLPFFFIRGAPPGDVGYFLDGIRVPVLFHVGIGPSVVHPALMDRVDLYPGGYPARFGRFSGGIVAGETTAPIPKLHGEYNARLFDAGALAEAPFAGERGSVLVAGRYSYTAALLTLLASGVQLDYWDYQARVKYDVTPTDTISAFGFGSYDYLGQLTNDQTITIFGAEFHRLDLRYDHKLPHGGNLRLAVTGGLDLSRAPQDTSLRDRVLGARSELEYRVSPAVLFRAGTDVELDSYDIQLPTTQLSQNANAAAAIFPTRTDLATGVRADAVLDLAPRLQVTPGVRLDLYSSDGAAALAVDPRLATRLELTKSARLLSAMGMAQQPPAFVVPIPGYQPGGLRGGLQHALQESIGLEYDVDDATTATMTTFHNAFFNMSDPTSYQPRQLSGCVPGSVPDDWVFGDRSGSANAGCPSPIKRPGTVGRDGGGDNGAMVIQALETRTLGTAYGLELFLKRRLTNRLGGFLSYTLSRSTRSVGQNSFVAVFDRTHVVNAALAYNLGRNWRAGTRVVFYTGVPKAPDPTDGSTRLPPFFRVDLRLEKRWQLGQSTWISFVAEWMNATLSKEAIGTQCSLNEGCQTQTVGPVSIPSIGVEGGF
jgi:TonB dependent receptor-like, beta-barrel/Gram-negative bacterial TonB protein C-terminal/TonB-dependent Receptor Plug Domain